MRKHGVKAAVVAVAMALVGVVSVTAAQAQTAPSPAKVTRPAVAPSASGDIHAESAYGTEPIGNFDFEYQGHKFYVPTGCFLTHGIDGDGLNVNHENAGTDCAGTAYLWGGFCNWEIDIEYKNLDGRVYGTRPGMFHSTCEYNVFEKWTARYHALVAGKACAVLWVGGAVRARQCHNILM